jgi:hypothetical protein
MFPNARIEGTRRSRVTKPKLLAPLAIAILLALPASANAYEIVLRAEGSTLEGQTLVWDGGGYSQYVVETLPDEAKKTITEQSYTRDEIRQKDPQDHYKPEPRPGQRVGYRVRVATGAQWSNTVYITYPPIIL